MVHTPLLMLVVNRPLISVGKLLVAASLVSVTVTPWMPVV